MPFAETIKSEAKRAASFHCVWCGQYNVFLEVHHITPEHQGGASDFENAVALCPNCHTQLGDNPTLRKAIKEKRDWWYEECQKRSKIPVFNPDILSDFTDKVAIAVASRNEQFMENSFEDIKTELREMLTTSLPYTRVDQRDHLKRFGESVIDSTNAKNLSAVASAVISSSTATITPKEDPFTFRIDPLNKPDKQ